MKRTRMSNYVRKTKDKKPPFDRYSLRVPSSTKITLTRLNIERHRRAVTSDEIKESNKVKLHPSLLFLRIGYYADTKETRRFVKQKAVGKLEREKIAQ